MTGQARTSRYGVALATIAAFLVILAVGVSMLVRLEGFASQRLHRTSEQGPTEDYVAYYTAGRMVLEGEGDHLYDQEAVTAKEHELMGRNVGGSGSLAFFNPPFVALFFAIPSLLPIAAFPVVLTCSLALMAVAAALSICRYLNLRGRQLLFAYGGFLTLQGVYWLLLEGQLSFFVFFAWIGFAYFHHREKKRMSGFSLAMGLVKPQMVILLLVFLIWSREWKTLRAFGMAAVMLVALSVAVSGPNVLLEYPQFLLQSTGFDGHGVATESMFGYNGLIARTTGDSTPSNLWLLGLAPATVAITLDSWRKAAPSSAFFPLTLAVSLSGTILLNPHLYFQDTVLVPLVVAFAVRGSGRAGLPKTGWVALLAIWIVQLLNFRLADADLNLLTPVTIGCFIASYVELRRRTMASAKIGTTPDDLVWGRKLAA